jgi:hypothetical protein
VPGGRLIFHAARRWIGTSRSDEQLRELITLEAKAVGLTYEEAIKRANDRTLPQSLLGADLELLVQLLPPP